MTCREGGNTATGERLGHGWSKHFCHRGGLPLKIQLFKSITHLLCSFHVSSKLKSLPRVASGDTFFQ